jgi:hypothetical protein
MTMKSLYTSILILGMVVCAGANSVPFTLSVFDGTLSANSGALVATGKLTSGDYQMGATFGAGTFGGVECSSFTWTLTTLANGTHSYTLVGLSGSGGMSLSVNTGKGFFNGITVGSTYQPTSVPEAPSLILLGTGLLGIAEAVRRKVKSKEKQ